MAIPKYDELRLPVLDYLSQVERADYKELMSFVQKHFKLSEDEMRETFPNSGALKIYTRISWGALGFENSRSYNKKQRYF